MRPSERDWYGTFSRQPYLHRKKTISKRRLILLRALRDVKIKLGGRSGKGKEPSSVVIDSY